jgi:hypothetical protein
MQLVGTETEFTKVANLTVDPNRQELHSSWGILSDKTQFQEPTAVVLRYLSAVRQKTALRIHEGRNPGSRQGDKDETTNSLPSQANDRDLREAHARAYRSCLAGFGHRRVYSHHRLSGRASLNSLWQRRTTRYSDPLYSPADAKRHRQCLSSCQVSGGNRIVLRGLW